MPANRRSVNLIAECLTEHPDVLAENTSELLDEMFWGGSKTKSDPLAQLVDKNQIRQIVQMHRCSTQEAQAQALQDIQMEYKAYIRYNRLEDNEESKTEFVTYKKTGKIPARGKDPRDLDQMGGRDFRSDGRLPK